MTPPPQCLHSTLLTWSLKVKIRYDFTQCFTDYHKRRRVTTGCATENRQSRLRLAFQQIKHGHNTPRHINFPLQLVLESRQLSPIKETWRNNKVPPCLHLLASSKWFCHPTKGPLIGEAIDVRPHGWVGLWYGDSALLNKETPHSSETSPRRRIKKKRLPHRDVSK